MDPVAEEAVEDAPHTPAYEAPFDQAAFRKAHTQEVGGQVAFVVGGIAAGVAVGATAWCFAVHNVSWRDNCLTEARLGVLTTGIALGGGGVAIYGAHGEAKALNARYGDGIIGIGALGASVPVMGLGAYQMTQQRPNGTVFLLAGVGLLNLGVAATSCQVHYNHQEARKYGLMGRNGLRLRNDWVFCGFLDAFTLAVTPQSAELRWRF